MSAFLRALLPALIRFPDWFKVLLVMAALFVTINQTTGSVGDLRAAVATLQGVCHESDLRLDALENRTSTQDTEIRLLREDIRRMEGKVDIVLQRTK